MRSYETEEPIAVSIEMSQGTVHVIAGSRRDTVVAVNPTDRNRSADVEEAAKTTADLANGLLAISTPRNRGIARHVVGWGRSGSIDVTIELPEGSSLTADTGVADFRCVGRLADVDIKTGVGDVRLDQTDILRIRNGVGRVTVERVTGDVDIVAGGDLTLGDVTGDAGIKNHTGRTTIGRVGGKVSVRSANGAVAIEDSEGEVTVKTANGDVRLGRVTRGSTSLETGFGSIEVGIREGTAAWVDANTKFGKIDNRLSPAGEPSEKTETAEIRARTAFGDVLITRA